MDAPYTCPRCGERSHKLVCRCGGAVTFTRLQLRFSCGHVAWVMVPSFGLDGERARAAAPCPDCLRRDEPRIAAASRAAWEAHVRAGGD